MSVGEQKKILGGHDRHLAGKTGRQQFKGGIMGLVAPAAHSIADEKYPVT